MSRARRALGRLRGAWRGLEARLRRRLVGARRHHVALMRKSWDDLHDRRGAGSISFLAGDAPWDEEEFGLVGERFVARMVARFEEHGATDLARRSVLEIGGGIGRFLRPLSLRFGTVVGVDISDKMLATAARRLHDRPNVELRRNNGVDLVDFADGAFDFCVCAGVLQHVTLRDVVLGYVVEGLRVVREGGLFLFQFRGNRDNAEAGSVLHGVGLRARDLSAALAGAAYRIREVSADPIDRNATLVVVLEKLPLGAAAGAAECRFEQQALAHKPWLEGVYDGLRTAVRDQRVGPDAPAARLTFFD